MEGAGAGRGLPARMPARGQEGRTEWEPLRPQHTGAEEAKQSFPIKEAVSGTAGAAWRSMASVRHGGTLRGGRWDHWSALLRHRLSWSSERHFRGRHQGLWRALPALPPGTCPERTPSSASPQGLCGHVPASRAGVSLPSLRLRDILVLLADTRLHSDLSQPLRQSRAAEHGSDTA